MKASSSGRVRSIAMMHICTYFDSRYLHMGLTLCRSIAKHCSVEFRIWVLCLDEETEKVLRQLNLPGISPISLKDVENENKALLEVKGSRERVEYYWTLSPILPLYIFRNHPEVDVITYVDADIAFFSDPHTVLDQLGDANILIDPHDFSDCYAHCIKYGKYNVGVLSFRNNEFGLECLNWWKERCLEFCGAKYVDGKYGDQSYLDEFPERFVGVVEAGMGVSLAPWNTQKHDIITSTDGRLLVDGEPVVCYHFQSLKFYRPWLIRLSEYAMETKLKKNVYRPYLKMLSDSDDYLKRNGFNIPRYCTAIKWRDSISRFRDWTYVKNFSVLL